MRRDIKQFNAHVEQVMANATYRGVTSDLLRKAVHDHVTAGVHPDNRQYNDLWELADQINRGGLRSQLEYLVDAVGLPGALRAINEISVLDTFIRRATSEENNG